MKIVMAVLVAMLVFAFVPDGAVAQTVCDPWGNCITIPPHTNPGNSGTTQRRPRGPSQKQLEERAREEEAHKLNEEGVAAWNERKWTLALELFRRAGGPNHRNKTIHANYLAALYRVMQDDIEQGNWDVANGNCQSGLLHDPNLKELKDLCAIIGPKYRAMIAANNAQYADNRAFNRANDLGKLGKASFEREDYALAETQYLEAARMYPSEPVWMQNVATCRVRLGDRVKDAGLREPNDDIALEHYRSAVAYYRGALEANPQNQYALATLPRVERIVESYEQHKHDEIAEAARKAQVNRDAMLVDARNLPSGIPADQERAIATAFGGSPPGVVQRVERGFQAVNRRDWTAAHAWFGDALLRDPNNVGLRNLLTLSVCAEDGFQRTPTPPSMPVVPQKVPDKADVDLFFKNFREGRYQQPSESVRQYVRSLSNDEFKRMLGQLQPSGEGFVRIFELYLPEVPIQ